MLKTAREELKINQEFFQINGEPWDAYKQHPGIDSICKLLDSFEDNKDFWLVFELCGKPLSKLLYSTKGQFFKGQRIYEVKQDQRVYEILQANQCAEFKKIVSSILQALCLLKKAGIVHCDLKAENILVSIDYYRKIVDSVKVIDFGSSFEFDKVNTRLEVTTPEYLPPEVLEFMDWKQVNMMSMQYATD